MGVGGTEQPLNVQLADVQSPTDVQLGDKFEVAAFVQAQGLSGKELAVELLAADADSTEPPTAVGEQRLTVPNDGAAVEVRFPISPAAAGKWNYSVRVKPVVAVHEFNEQDNQQTVVVNVFDRPTRVLLMAGGPMRDYQFVRNLVHRHKSMDVDVLLQTASVGTSQDSDHLLLQFPTQKEQFYDYDVVVAFDVDWQLIPGDGIELLCDWVYQEGGGLILVAGDVNTPQLAQLSQTSPSGDHGTPVQDQLLPLKELYPVALNSYLAELRFDQTSSQPWPISFTPEGQRAEFLQLTEDPLTSSARWKEFAGFYRCYPTAGSKAGATVWPASAIPVRRTSSDFRFARRAVLRPGPHAVSGQRRNVAAARGERCRLRPLLDQKHSRSGAGAIASARRRRVCRNLGNCSSAKTAPDSGPIAGCPVRAAHERQRVPRRDRSRGQTRGAIAEAVA